MRHLSYANAVATLALFIALGGVSWAAVTLPAHSVGAKQLKRNAVTGSAIRNGSVSSADLSSGVRRKVMAARQGDRGQQGPPGAAGGPGAKGDKGDKGDRGLNLAGSRQVANVNDVACDGTEVVVASMPLSVLEASRVWTHAQGAVDAQGSAITEAGLSLRLRDAGNTTTIAATVTHWAGRMTPNSLSTLAPGGLMLAGADPGPLSAPYTAAAGSYILQLVVRAQGGACGAAKPRFGWNQGQSMSYLLVGTQ